MKLPRLLRAALPLLVLVLTSASARADEVANRNAEGAVFRSRDGGTSVTLRIAADADGPPRAVIESARRKRKYLLPLEPLLLQNGDFIVSDDGDWIIWQLKFRFLSRPITDSAPAIIFFKDGAETGRLGIKRLVKQFAELPRSTAHTHWLLRSTPDFAAGTLGLVTTEYRTFTARLSDAKLLDEGVLPAFAAAPSVVRGYFESGGSEVERFATGALKFNARLWLKGDGPVGVIDVHGIDPRFGKPSGAHPVVLRQEGGKWFFGGHFYDLIEHVPPPSPLKYGAVFLPRIAAELKAGGMLKLKRLASGDEGLVLLTLMAVTGSHAPVVAVVPAIRFESATKDRPHPHGGVGKLPAPQPVARVFFASGDGSFREAAGSSQVLMLSGMPGGSSSVRLLSGGIPSPGPGFTLYDQSALRMADNPVTMVSSASDDDVKRAFGMVPGAKLEVR